MMGRADSGSFRKVWLTPDQFYFNDRGELVIKNVELIEAIKGQLAGDEGDDVQGYAMSGGASAADSGISIGITHD